jgi:hypothetical protein
VWVARDTSNILRIDVEATVPDPSGYADHDPLFRRDGMARRSRGLSIGAKNLRVSKEYPMDNDSNMAGRAPTRNIVHRIGVDA